MKITFLGAVCSALLWISTAQAQTVAVIGLDSVKFDSAKEGQKLPDDLDAATAELMGSLRQQLLATRKFKVLSRNEANAVLNEHGLNIDGITMEASEDTIFDVPGLDYLLNATITQFDESTGTGVILLNLRSTSYPLNSETKEIVVKPREATGTSTATHHSISDQIVFKTIATVFPIRVMDMDEDGFVTLNYGQGLLNPGTRLQVYAPIDPPTNGAIEAGEVKGSPVAVIEVTNSDEKFATAKVSEGVEDLKLGFKVALLER